MMVAFRKLKHKPKKAETKTPVVQKYVRRRRAYVGNEQQGSPAWLITFTDTMGLMLTFFVMMYAMSVPEDKAWKEMTDSVQSSFNRFYGAAYNRGQEDSTAIERWRFSKGLDLDYLQNLFRTLIEQDKTLKDVRIMQVEDGLIVSLPDNLLFESGSAKITPAGLRALYTLGASLDRIKNRIEIIGHTDPRPVTGKTYGSNWELSFDRAASVAAALQNTGYEKPLAIRGYASSRYEDIAGTLPEQERLSLSRRVDIMIMEDDGSRIKMLDIIGR